MTRSLLVGTAVLAAACGWGLAQAQPQPSPSAPAPAAQPAPGDASTDPAMALIKDRCTLCHDTDVIAATGRAPAAWDDLVRSMMRKGATLSDAEEAQVAAYLAKAYPPAAN